jgi:outer membrane protein TolC
MPPIPRAAALASLLLAARAASAEGPRTLGLEEALRDLEAHGPSAAQARSRAAAAAAVVAQAAAPLLPTLAASGSYTRNSDEAKVVKPAVPPQSPSTLYIQPLEAWAAGGSLRLPIAIPSAWADLAAARHGAAAAEAGAQASLQALRLAVVQGAWLEASAEEIAAAADRALATAREQARSARRAVEAGVQPRLSALASETQAVRREGDRVRAQASLEKAQLALGVLLGRDERVRIPVTAPAAAPAPDPEALAQEALRRRPEMRAQGEQLAAAESQVTAARLRWLPQLSATGSAFAQDVPFPTGKDRGWRAMVELTWPLYDGGLRYGKRRQAEAEAAGARAAAEGQRLAVLQEVEDAARELRVSAERLRLAEQQQAVAADAAATAKRGFEAGTTGNVEVLAANDDLFQAEVGLAQARAGLGAAAAALDRAAGRL